MITIEFTLGGRSYRVTTAEVESRLNGIQPEAIREHYVTVKGRDFPIKHAFAEGVVPGIDRLDFTTAFARRVFQRLEFPVARM